MSQERLKPLQLETCTLVDLLSALEAGVPVVTARAGSEAYQLKEDSRRILAFYGQNRSLWALNRNVQEREIEQLLEALGKDLPQTHAPHVTPGGEPKTYCLRRIEAFRFAGLSRHCNQDGSDPEVFRLDLDHDLTLVEGFNGAGRHPF